MTRCQAFSGEFDSVPGAFERLMATGGEPSVTLAAALRYAVALHRARLAIESGQSIDQAIGLVFRSGVGRPPRLDRETFPGVVVGKTVPGDPLLGRSHRPHAARQRLGAALAERALLSIAEGVKDSQVIEKSG